MGEVQIDRRGFFRAIGVATAGVGCFLTETFAQAYTGLQLTVGPIRRIGTDAIRKGVTHGPAPI